MESLHALSSTHWDHEPERGRSPAAARRQLGGLRKTRTPWSWRERCARGPGALRVQRFMGSGGKLPQSKLFVPWHAADEAEEADRKSTRLNSSHRTISYAV